VAFTHSSRRVCVSQQERIVFVFGTARIDSNFSSFADRADCDIIRRLIHQLTSGLVQRIIERLGSHFFGLLWRFAASDRKAYKREEQFVWKLSSAAQSAHERYRSASVAGACHAAR
jgi:hypothetical protein